MANTRRLVEQVDSARRVEEARVADANRKMLKIMDEQVARLAKEYRQIDEEFAELARRKEECKRQHQQFVTLREAFLHRTGVDAPPLPAGSLIEAEFTLDDAIASVLSRETPISTNAVIERVQALAPRLGREPSAAAIRARLYKPSADLNVKSEKRGKESFWTHGAEEAEAE